jgi:hypothetical protein
MPDYRGGELDPARGPGLGCFWFQVAVLGFFLVLIPLGIQLNWSYEVLAVLLFIVIGLLLFVGQTVIFLLRLVAADRRGPRRPLASATPTVGEMEDQRAGRLAAAQRGEVAPPELDPIDRELVDGAAAIALDILRQQASFVPFARAIRGGDAGPELFAADLDSLGLRTAAEAEDLLAARLGGFERVALVADARASLPDLPGPRDVIRVDLLRHGGERLVVAVPYVRSGSGVRALPGVLVPATVAGVSPPPGSAGVTPPAGDAGAGSPPPSGNGDASSPPGGGDGMRE